jgi:hypothetical protein
VATTLPVAAAALTLLGCYRALLFGNSFWLCRFDDPDTPAMVGRRGVLANTTSILESTEETIDCDRFSMVNLGALPA